MTPPGRTPRDVPQDRGRLLHVHQDVATHRGVEGPRHRKLQHVGRLEAHSPDPALHARRRPGERAGSRSTPTTSPEAPTRLATISATSPAPSPAPHPLPGPDPRAAKEALGVRRHPAPAASPLCSKSALPRGYAFVSGGETIVGRRLGGAHSVALLRHLRAPSPCCSSPGRCYLWFSRSWCHCLSNTALPFRPLSLRSHSPSSSCPRDRRSSGPPRPPCPSRDRSRRTRWRSPSSGRRSSHRGLRPPGPAVELRGVALAGGGAVAHPIRPELHREVGRAGAPVAGDSGGMTVSLKKVNAKRVRSSRSREGQGGRGGPLDRRSRSKTMKSSGSEGQRPGKRRVRQAVTPAQL